MTHMPVNLPLRGFTEQTQFSVTPEGMTQSCLNVLPIDPWNGKTRIGTRTGTIRYSNGPVQFLGTYRVYESGLLVEKLIVVRNGIVYYGNPQAATPATLSMFGGQGTVGSTAPKLNTTAVVEGVQFNERFYFVDGDNYVIVDIVNPTGATAVAYWGGTSPNSGPYHTDPAGVVAGDRARLICRWGARLVLAGYRKTPNIWFACAPDKPYPNAAPDGWDFPDAIGAVGAALSAEYGTLGDPIVAIFPFAQTGLMFGCSNSFAFITNDPIFDNGNQTQIVYLTRSIGIAGQRAFCQAQEKGAYILATDGLYFLSANDFNFNRANRISAGRLDSFFLRLDFGTPAIGGSSTLAGGTVESLLTEYGSGSGASAEVLDGGSLSSEATAADISVPNATADFLGGTATGEVFPCLCYDPDREGVWMFLTVNGVEQSSLHLYYDVKTDSFWPQRFFDPYIFGPSSAAYTGPSRTKSGRLFLGGAQGISILNRTSVVGIDGYDSEGMSEADQRARFVRSSVTIGPIIPQLPYRAMLTEVRVDMNEDQYELPSTFPTDYSAGPVLSVSIGDTAQAAIGLQTDSIFVTNINPLVADCGSSTTGSLTPLYDGGNSTTTSPVNLIDGRYAVRPFGTYLQNDRFAEGTSRLYDGPEYWVVRYDSDRWKVMYDAGPAASPRYTAEYEQIDADPFALNGTMVTTIQFPIAPHIKDNAVVSGASFESASIVEIGNLNRGRNDAKKCRIRSEAMFLTIASDGKPYAVERMSAVVTQVGKSRGD